MSGHRDDLTFAPFAAATSRRRSVGKWWARRRTNSWARPSACMICMDDGFSLSHCKNYLYLIAIYSL